MHAYQPVNSNVELCTHVHQSKFSYPISRALSNCQKKFQSSKSSNIISNNNKRLDIRDAIQGNIN